ncbi:MAG: response regulator transcription factor [Spirochaetes bacterium]|uniref:Response regulator transcription factor n=1 Tax=Candidatus Ornithospirochaeta stercoripullorum TaxID=2840899 RepID=A0A9D9DWZ6_9SPIO|nr:response regulator transcription factor [Candidatus Ornithospirochaeta stercoripullorum]
MKLIYIVEDHDVIRNGVVQYLAISGYEAVGQRNIEEVRTAFENRVPDLLIQDVMLPDGDGFSFVKEVKQRYPKLPVIFLTARTEESDRILGFELGADDYISKPFSPKELVLRIQALFRRIDELDSNMGDNVYKYHDGDNTMVIDDNEHVLSINGSPIALTAAEWRIVFYLASNSPNLITRAQILEECFDYSFESYERVVDTHIKNIRAKLKPGSWIDTVRGYGYRFSGKKA